VSSRWDHDVSRLGWLLTDSMPRESSPKGRGPDESGDHTTPPGGLFHPSIESTPPWVAASPTHPAPSGAKVDEIGSIRIVNHHGSKQPFFFFFFLLGGGGAQRR